MFSGILIDFVTLGFLSEGRSLSVLLLDMNANLDLVQKMSGRLDSANSKRQIAPVFRNACLDHLLPIPIRKSIAIIHTTATTPQGTKAYGGLK